ncbi:hypothetical protein [Candidatus Poriferisocius sp.]|uniref:hypothetical protein n=1 Tax=Candidatus Poriferisocius sp. TaxID=3101276 RepID=UPI003B029722
MGGPKVFAPVKVEAARRVIEDEWSSVCDQAELTKADRNRLWGRQFLNPFALYNY